MRRREFVAGLAAAVSSLPGWGQAGTKATLEIDAGKVGATIPPDFTGLSYESASWETLSFFLRRTSS